LLRKAIFNHQNFSLMKLLRNYGIAVVAALTIVMTSCGGGPIEHGRQYVLQGPDGAAAADMQTTQQVIENRLNNFGLEGDFEITTQDNKITVRVRDGAIEDSVRLRKLLQSSGGLKFRAMFNFYEVWSFIDSAQKTYCRMNNVDSLSAPTSGLMQYFVMSEYITGEGPLITYCKIEDTAAVNAILRTDSIAAIFPSDLVFHWGRGEYLESAGPTLSLFACKEGRNYVMSGTGITSAQAHEGNGSYEISLNFDPVGAGEFTKITKANVGRSLAIELDNFVYSYPMVNMEITGGKAEISGNFTEMEADDIEKLLSSGSLPLNFRIAEETTF
jgi:preprotein translocase subunit SecD